MSLKLRTRGFDLRQLEYFCSVARTGSFTKAAEELGIAQPSLSEQIAKLEKGLGAALFERLNRRIELTPLGEAILGKAQALLADAATLPEYFERAREGVHGPLRVGAIPTVLPYFVAPLLKGFTTLYQDVDLHVREGTTTELVGQVLDGHCCPRQDTPVAGAAENRRLGAAKWAASGGGLGFDVPQPVQVTAVPV